MWEIKVAKPDRLDRALRNSREKGSEWLSRQAWDWLIEHGHVSVNGRRCTKAGQEMPEGATIKVELPAALGLLPASQSAKPIWEREDLALFSKPVGVDTLPIFPWDHSAFANQVVAYRPQSSQLSAPPNLEGGVLQRLDRDTSGLICVAFTPEVKSLFRQLFSRSAFTKTYLALVEKPVEGDRKIWLQPSGAAKVRAQLNQPKGEAEECRLTVEIYKKSSKGALVKVRTRGGARHIVRAGMAALGAPLLGDALYGGSPATSHHQLHASQLELAEQSAYPDFPNSLLAPPPQSFLDCATSLGIEFQG